MPSERLPQPPPRLPVSEFRNPDPDQVIFTELVSRRDPAYDNNAPIPRGTLYSTMQGAKPEVIAAYPTLVFLRETKLGNTEDWVIWTWNTIPDAEDSYNAEVDYVSESTAAPQFSRVYTVQRDIYDAEPFDTLGLPLDSIVSVTVEDGGSGYTTGDTVQFNSLTGSGAAAVLVVDSNGTIQSVVLNMGGSGYTPTPTVSIVSATGAGAVLIANLQPQTAVLVAQKKQEFPEDHPLSLEYVKVTMVYETLPGPFITTYRVDDDGFTVTVKRRHNLQTAIDAISPKETLVTGTWTRFTSEPVNESYFVGWDVQESRTVPGNPIESTSFRSDGSTIQTFRTLKQTSTITPGGLLFAGALTLTSIKEVSDLVSYEIKEISSVPGPPVHGEHIDDTYGLVIDIVKTVVPDGTSPSPNPAVDGTYYEIKPKSEWESVQIASKFDITSLPSPVQWFGGQMHSFPPELITGTYDPVTNPYGAIIQWADATCGCKERFSAVLQTNFNQYSGVVKARYTEQFYYGVPPDDVVIDQFFPQSHTFGFAFASVCNCGSNTTASVTAIAPQFKIPLCIHDTFSLCVGNPVPFVCSGAPFSWTFNATTPAALPHGSYIMLPPHVERWRFGVWRRVLTEVLVP